MDSALAIQWICLMLLVVCAIGVSVTKKLFIAVIIFMAYSSILAIIWLLLRATDLAMTQAAVGAGIDSILFFVTLRKLHQIKGVIEKK